MDFKEKLRNYLRGASYIDEGFCRIGEGFCRIGEGFVNIFDFWSLDAYDHRQALGEIRKKYGYGKSIEDSLREDAESLQKDADILREDMRKAFRK